MVHFSCDLCGREMQDERYVVTLEVRPAFDPDALHEEDLDADHLEKVAAMLADVTDAGQLELEDCSAKSFRFDLCSECRARYVEDPLSRDALRGVNFSEN